VPLFKCIEIIKKSKYNGGDLFYSTETHNMMLSELHQLSKWINAGIINHEGL